jgi:ribosomal protein S20
VIAVSAKKGVINKKNMARKVSRLAKLVNSMKA